MEGEEQEKENEGEGEETAAPPPEEPPPEEPPPEESAPAPSPSVQNQPPPEEATPPPEEPPPPSRGVSLEPMGEEQSPAALESTLSSHPVQKSTSILKQRPQSERILGEKASAKRDSSRLAADGGGGVNIPGIGNISCSRFLQKRSPFIHNPPQPEERRARISNPRTPREYIINLREDLADFQESHGLPRTRDYSFLSLGLALAQETARALCSLFLMFAELFPIVAIVSLLMRFALDKLIEILETSETVPKVKKSIIFALQMLVIIIPLWIFIVTIIIPLLSLVLSIFKRLVQFRGRGRKCGTRAKTCPGISFLGLFP